MEESVNKPIGGIKEGSSSNIKEMHGKVVEKEHDPNSFHSVTPPLNSGILSYITSKNFTSMTPVQRTVIPLFLQNRDVCVRAVTGSGKTLSFLIPIIERMLRTQDKDTLKKPTSRKRQRKEVSSVVVSPTRELARQTFTVAKELCQRCGVPEPILFVGGTSPTPSDASISSNLNKFIVVGTPGRLEEVLTTCTTDYYNDIHYDVSDLDVLVLDEADVLLDMGFEQTIQSILNMLPRMRRTGLFSATWPGEDMGGRGSGGAMKKFMSHAGLRNPVIVDVTVTSPVQEKNVGDSKPLKQKQHATPSSLSNFYMISPLDEKLSRLVAFLKQHRDEKVIVFVLTCACVEFYGAVLKNLLSGYKVQVETLHGRMVQKRREKTMERFRCDCDDDDNNKENGGVLLCTDVAARGLDVPDVRWTVQFDAPQDPDFYVHRVGRSARAGKVGSSLICLTEDEESYIDFLRLRKVKIDELTKDDNEDCAPIPLSLADQEDDDEEEDGKERIIQSARGSDIPDVLPNIRKLVMQDRDVLEKGTKAFTSYIRAYKEHNCAFIFRFATLDLGLLATSFCLLRLPKMPELKHKFRNLPNFTPAPPEVDIYSIQYKDKPREKARQKRLAAELAAGGKNAKQVKAERRLAERLQRKKERIELQIKNGTRHKETKKKKRGRHAKIMEEWEELAKEERLHKKLKKGTITKEKYKALMYGGDGGKDRDSIENDMIEADLEI